MSNSLEIEELRVFGLTVLWALHEEHLFTIPLLAMPYIHTYGNGKPNSGEDWL